MELNYQMELKETSCQKPLLSMGSVNKHVKNLVLSEDEEGTNTKKGTHSQKKVTKKLDNKMGHFAP